MLQAEIRGKLNLVEFGDEKRKQDPQRMEDVLTSNLFGILKNVDLLILNSLLKEARIQGFKKKPRFEFWPRFCSDRTQPDVIIQDDERYIIVEVKYLSSFDKGTAEKKPQVIREVDGAKEYSGGKEIVYLAVTREQDINWQENVFSGEKNYSVCIDNYLENDILHHISWERIYVVLKRWTRENNGIDSTSIEFLKDLIEYLEKKEIGFVKKKSEGKRELGYYFGEEIISLENLARKYNFNICLNKLELEERKRIYAEILRFISRMKEKSRLQRVKSRLDIKHIPIDLLLGVSAEEIEPWSHFVISLFLDQFVMLNGKSDFSVKLKFQKGNYTKQAKSLFTYKKKSRRMVFKEKA